MFYSIRFLSSCTTVTAQYLNNKPNNNSFNILAWESKKSGSCKLMLLCLAEHNSNKTDIIAYEIKK